MVREREITSIIATFVELFQLVVLTVGLFGEEYEIIGFSSWQLTCLYGRGEEREREGERERGRERE